MHNITSPATSDSSIGAEIQAKGLTAPRVTQADIEAEIVGEHYFTARDGVAEAEDLRYTAIPGPLHLLTFCVLVLRNGFTVTGESACASPEIFDAAIGRKLARAKAIDKIGPLLGFRLRDRLAATPPAAPAQEPNECRIELVTAIYGLISHVENTLYAFRDDEEAKRQALGAITHARNVTARWNWNGPWNSAAAEIGKSMEQTEGEKG